MYRRLVFFWNFLNKNFRKSLWSEWRKFLWSKIGFEMPVNVSKLLLNSFKSRLHNSNWLLTWFHSVPTKMSSKYIWISTILLWKCLEKFKIPLKNSNFILFQCHEHEILLKSQNYSSNFNVLYRKNLMEIHEELE